ncbi:MAG: P-type conjugative transfer protein TrbJ [Desulfobulbaceae bacterium]|nr:P-type conjugative transfer protein TrbJ [Desulfobulbaceae bacterium]
MNMKKTFSVAVLSALLIVGNPGTSSAIFCSNCSTVFQQVLEYATQLQELAELVTQTKEAIKQTEMDIKNLEKLGKDLRDNPLETLLDLADKTAKLNTYRAEENVLAQIFNELFPEQSEFADLAGATRDEIKAANEKYQKHYDEWSKAIDQATQATFQLSGRQLKDLEESGELRDYLENLLNDPEGQMQAIQAGNQLATLQLQEIRQFRELAATQAQSEITQQMKQEKQEEAANAQHQEATKADLFDNGPKNDKKFRLY